MRGGAVALALMALGGASDAQAATSCGTKQLYGHALAIEVVGEPLRCARVRAIVRGRCETGRRWSCFSFRPPDPQLVWFRERERFRRRWSTTIVARRYPCTQARVTRRSWKRAYRRLRGFPSRAQVLADDLLRCRLLRGYSRREALRLLGRPTETDALRGKRYLYYDVGLERDSFFQVDSEVLRLRFDNGRFEQAAFFQT